MSDTGKVGGLEGGEADPKPSVGDEEFGGTEARKQLEKNLLWKLDIRMSILIVIYILNYVSVSGSLSIPYSSLSTYRLIGTMLRSL